jgi:hypothetical protein
MAKTKKRKRKVRLDRREIDFLISLYPKGRSEASLLRQLKERFPDTNEAILRHRMGRWIRSLQEEGLLSLVQTEESGNVVSLSSSGISLVRSEIRRLYSERSERFVSVMDRVVGSGDKWAISFFRQRALELVGSNLPFFTLSFSPAKLGKIAAALRDDFGVDIFQREGGSRFKDTVQLMDAMGLVDVKETEEGLVIGATQFARTLFSEAIGRGGRSATRAPAASAEGGSRRILAAASIVTGSAFFLLGIFAFPDAAVWMGLSPLSVPFFQSLITRALEWGRRHLGWIRFKN